MTTPKIPITGDEPYYPFFTYNKSGYGNSIVTGRSPEEQKYFNFNPGITIKQKFIADYMTPMAFEGATEENIRTHSFLAEKAFEAYLKIINGE